MTIIVGVDLQRRSAGALRFGAWCAATLGEGLRCLHIVGEDFVRHSLAFHALNVVMRREQAAAAASVRETLGEFPCAVEIQRAEVVSDALLEVQKRGDMLIVGRCAGKTSRFAPFRLGAVARRVLRRASAPVFVVPPDLERVGDGPVVLASSCDSAADRALPFARAFAEKAARPLVAVHAVESPDLGEMTARGHTRGTADSFAVEQVQAAGARLREWADRHGLKSDEALLLDGIAGPTEQLVTFVQRSNAAILVTAPHTRSYLQQLAGTSFSGELAGYAPCPVAVV